MLLHPLAAVLFLPAAILSLAAGALFGMWLGLLFVWIAAVIGESISFLLGRFLLRRWVQELTENWPSWHAMEAALAEDGWKLVALLRVSPVSIGGWALWGGQASCSCHTRARVGKSL